MEKKIKNSVRRTTIQKIIAERMALSKQTKPCFYIGVKADVTELIKLRPKLRKSLGIKITTNTFYIRALALAVQKYPLVTAMPQNQNLKIADNINVGFAVNAPQGLIVPVIKNTENLTLADIAAAEKSLTNRTRSNKLKLPDLEGKTIALSNLGAYDIDSFIGIVPPPVSTIISVGNAANQLVAVNGTPSERKIVSLTLAADASVVNEIYAAKFLRFIVELLENPQQLIGN